MTYTHLYILTGASRGLGEAMSSLLLKPEHHLVCISRTKSDTLIRQAESVGVRLDWYEKDLAALAEGEAEAFMQEIMKGVNLSGLTSIRLINNAGMLEPIGPAHLNSSGEVARHIALNLTAPIMLTGAFLNVTEQVQADKRILNISSGAGRTPYAGWSAYCAAKAGLDHFTRCVKLEQDRLPHGAKLVSAAPGVIDTAMQASIRSAGGEKFPSHARFVELHENGSLLAPHAAAASLLTLLEHPSFGEEAVLDIRSWQP